MAGSWFLSFMPLALTAGANLIPAAPRTVLAWSAVSVCLVQVLRVGGGNPNGTGEKRSEKETFLKGQGLKQGNLGSVLIILHCLLLEKMNSRTK